jgi:hypothetical protein
MTERTSDDGQEEKGGFLSRAAGRSLKVLGAGPPVTEAAKAKLLAGGIDGRATILKAPSKHRVTEIKENVGRFTVRVELPGEEPYEVKVWQGFWAEEWRVLQPGAAVPCKVHPKDYERVLLVVDEYSPEEKAPRAKVKGGTLNLGGLRKERVLDSSQVLADGRPATATVLSSGPMGKMAPGTEDEFYLLHLELHADDEPKSWKVEFGQRVPKGSEEMVAKGMELQVAFAAVGDPDQVAVDWPATSGGRFS